MKPVQLSWIHEGNLLSVNKRTTEATYQLLTVSVSDVNWVACNLLRCLLFRHLLCRLLQQPFIVTLLVALLSYLSMAHKITLQLLLLTVYCRVSDSKSPHYTLPKGRQYRNPLSISVPERGPESQYVLSMQCHDCHYNWAQVRRNEQAEDLLCVLCIFLRQRPSKIMS